MSLSARLSGRDRKDVEADIGIPGEPRVDGITWFVVSIMSKQDKYHSLQAIWVSVKGIPDNLDDPEECNQKMKHLITVKADSI